MSQTAVITDVDRMLFEHDILPELKRHARILAALKFDVQSGRLWLLIRDIEYELEKEIA
jgi:hypothetical protein